ncbi:RNA polymerase sigma factor [Streptomyces mirabilis]|uniref:RNA polymerase sigma factor n=1 Tax=Streptomyces mirabilis TaxID=68239 RepID=UPI00369A79FE
MAFRKRGVGPVAPPDGGAAGAEFEAFYRENAPRALLFVSSKGVPEQDVQEVVAASFTRMWSRWQTDGAPEGPRPYLYRVLQNRIADYWRERAQRARLVADSVDDTDLVSSRDDFTESVELAAQVRDLLGGLPERQRQVLMLSVMGLPTRVIADQLEITTGAVRTHLAAARRTLRHDMDESRMPREAFE